MSARRSDSSDGHPAPGAASDPWEYPGASGDETFGVFNVGLSLSVPLAGVPADFGSWEFTAGIQFLMFGDGLIASNSSDDDFRPIGVFGLGLGY